MNRGAERTNQCPSRSPVRGKHCVLDDTYEDHYKDEVGGTHISYPPSYPQTVTTWVINEADQQRWEK